MLSSMTPTFVFKEDKLESILGSPGGSHIITTVLHTLLAKIIFEQSIKSSVLNLRYHHQWVPDRIDIEPNAIDEKSQRSLEKLGHKLFIRTNYFGDMQAISKEEGRWVGVSDWRSDGVPAGG